MVRLLLAVLLLLLSLQREKLNAYIKKKNILFIPIIAIKVKIKASFKSFKLIKEILGYLYVNKFLNLNDF